MKKSIIFFALIMCLTLGPKAFAEGNNLSLENVLKGVDTSRTLKSLDYAITKVERVYNKLNDAWGTMPSNIRRQLESQLTKDASGGTVTVYLFGAPVYEYDHTLSRTEINQVLSNFGFSPVNKEKLAQDKMTYITPSSTFSSLNNLKKKREIAKQSLKLGAEQLFNGIIITDQAIELQKEIVVVGEVQYKNAQEKYNQGFISQNDLVKAKIQYEQGKLKLQTQQRARQNMIYSLNKMMGVKVNTTYDRIDGEIKQADLPKIDLEATITKAIENRAEIYEINEEIKNKEKELLFTSMYYGAEEPEYRLVEIGIDSAKDKLESTKEDIRFEIESAYDTIEQNFDAIDQAQIELENSNSRYNDVKSKFDRGLITKDILDATHIQVSAAELKLMSAINTYNLSIKKFDAAIGVGPGIK